MCETCMVVPWREIAVGHWSVSRAASPCSRSASGPSAWRCVDVNRERAVPCRACRLRPGCRRASPSAWEAGEPEPPSPPDESPPDARGDLEQPFHLLDERRRRSDHVRERVAAGRDAESFCSSVTSSGSLGKRIASSSADRGSPAARRAPVDGQVVREVPPVGESGHTVTEVRKRPQPTVTPRPDG